MVLFCAFCILSQGYPSQELDIWAVEDSGLSLHFLSALI
jgi:hypothetical protein